MVRNTNTRMSQASLSLEGVCAERARGSAPLRDRPGVAGVEQRRPGRPRPAAPWRLVELLRHQLVVDRPLDRRGRRRPAPRRPRRASGATEANASDGSGVRSSWTSSASSPTSATSPPAPSRPARARTPALALVAEADRLAVLQVDAVRPCRRARRRRRRRCRCCSSGRSRRTPCPWCSAACAQHLGQPLLVRVDRARDERRLGAERDRQRVERMVERAHRRRLRHLAELGSSASTGPSSARRSGC